MLSYIYDNGYQLMGLKTNIVKYIKANINEDNYEDCKSLLEDLNDYPNTDVLIINYDSGMGCYIECCFSKNEKISMEE